MPLSRNYAQRLGIGAPDLAALAARKDTKLIDLLFGALVEAGGPLSPEEVAERLQQLPEPPETPDLVRSLLRSAASCSVIYRDEEDRFALELGNPDDPDLHWRLLMLRFDPAAPRPTRPEPPAPPPPPPDDQPLSLEEVEDAFRDAWLGQLSGLRQAAALLDAHSGGPRRLSELEAELAALTPHRIRLNLEHPWSSIREPLERHGEDQVVLDRSSPKLITIRRLIRERRAKEQQGKLAREASREEMESFRRRRQQKERAQRQAAQTLRRALVHGIPGEDPARGAVLLDAATRKLSTFLGDELDELRKKLPEYDLIIALETRNTLQRLGIEDEPDRLIDLDRPQKTRTINSRGKKLQLTNNLLISSTLGLKKPLTAATTYRKHLDAHRPDRVRQLLETDAKNLWAYYRYGVLHHAVRLRWRSVDDLIPAPWALQGDPSLDHLIHEAAQSGDLVELVGGSPPDWSDPWSRAVAGQPIPDGPYRWTLALLQDPRNWTRFDEVFEARVVEVSDRN